MIRLILGVAVGYVYRRQIGELVDRAGQYIRSRRERSRQVGGTAS